MTGSDDVDPPDSSALRRDRCGEYRLLRLLATGGMGDLYVALPEGSPADRVAIKKIRLDHVGRRDVVTLFEREVVLNSALDHPNIVKVLEVGEDTDGPFMVMEYLRGLDLRAVIRELEAQGGGMGLPAAVQVCRSVLSALEHAHGRLNADGVQLGIVHRDVSPSNIFLTEAGEVKLLDFGIAKFELATPTTLGAAPKGKGAYMAPEQCRNEPVDVRADIFALGAVLYEATTMRRAFLGDNMMATLNSILSGDVVPPHRLVEGYPPALEAVIMRALTLDADERYQTAADMARALDEVRAEQGWDIEPGRVRTLVRQLQSSSSGHEPIGSLRHGRTSTRFETSTLTGSRDELPKRRPTSGRWGRALAIGTTVGVLVSSVAAYGVGLLGAEVTPLASVSPRPARISRAPLTATGYAMLSRSREGVDRWVSTDGVAPCRAFRARVQAARENPTLLASVRQAEVPDHPGAGETASDCLGLGWLKADLIGSSSRSEASRPKSPGRRSRTRNGDRERTNQDDRSRAPGTDVGDPDVASTVPDPSRGRKRVGDRLHELRRPDFLERKSHAAWTP